VTLSSTLSAKVTKLQYIGKPESKLAQVRSYEVFTEVIPRDLAVKPDIIPLWIVVLAAVAGTAILLLLVYLLYKVNIVIGEFITCKLKILYIIRKPFEVTNLQACNYNFNREIK